MKIFLQKTVQQIVLSVLQLINPENTTYNTPMLPVCTRIQGLAYIFKYCRSKQLRPPDAQMRGVTFH